MPYALTRVLLFTICLPAIFRAASVQDYCVVDEQASFVAGIADVSILGAQCDFTYPPSKACCDTVQVMVQHPCAEWAGDNYNDKDSFNSPSNIWDFLLKGLELCRIELGGHRIGVEACGDGFRNSTEQCDDGNDWDGDGCTDCFIDDGFDCTEPSDSGASTCRTCAETCRKQYRTICEVDGGACGECLEGYALRADGQCGRVKTMLYAPINSYFENSTTGCSSHYYEVGTVVDPGPFGSAEDLVRMVREWKPDRSQFLDGEPCSLFGLLRSSQATGEDLLIAAELLLDEVNGRSSYVERSKHVLVFSDGKKRAISGDDLGGIFDVYYMSKLYLYNVHIIDCRGSNGGFLLNYGETIVENVTVSECAERPILTLAFTCSGHLLESMGPSLKLHNVVFTNNSFSVLPGSGMCLVYMRSLVSLAFNTVFSNVTFEDNYSDGVMVHIKHSTDISVFEDVHFVRNTCGRSVLLVDVDAELSDVVVAGNVVMSSAAVVVSGESFLERAYLVGNEVSEDVGVLSNLGWCNVVHAVVANNTSPLHSAGGAVLNKGVMSIESSIFEGNAIGAIRSQYWLFLQGVVFRENLGTSQFSTIYNTGYLEMSLSNITDTNTHMAPTVASEMPFIARDCVLPDASDLRIASCEEVLFLPDGSQAATCGVNAICSESFLGGRHCDCPPGFLGDETDVCSRVPALHILPEAKLVNYVTKISANQTSVEVLGIGSDGLGELSWEVDETSLPTWASITPLSGAYTNKDMCISVDDLTFTMNLAGISASDPIRHATIRFLTNATVGGKVYPSDSVELSVSLHVEARANATWSTVAPTSKHLCDPDLRCEVEGGKEVKVEVVMLDSGRDPMGMGGTSFSVRVLTILDFAWRAEDASNLVLVRLEDFDNGTYEASFQAPLTHFVLVVDIDGDSVSGTPLVFDVVCGDGFEWSSGAGPDGNGFCVEEAISVPKHVIATVLVLLLVFFFGTFSWLYRNRRYFEEMFQLIMTEVFSLTLCGVAEFLDLMSDIGALVSILLADDLHVYAPYYLVIVPFSLLMSIAYFSVLLSDLRKALRKEKLRVYGRARQPGALRRSVFAVGVGTLDTVGELDEAIRQMDSKERRMFLELVLMFVEDVPTLTLSLFVVTGSESTPLPVYIAMMFSSVLMGVTLTNFRGIKDSREQRTRLQSRRSEAVKQLDEDSYVTRGTQQHSVVTNAGRAKKKGLGAVVLEMCTIS
eukprot:Rmarinus@m.28371